MVIRTLEHGVPGILDVLSAEETTALAESEVLVEYRDGEQIQQRGDEDPGLRIVRAGAVRVGNVGSDGEYLALAVLGPGQTYGEMTLFADLPRSFDMHAIGRATIGHIDPARMQRLLEERPELTALFLRTLATQLHATLELVEDLRRLSVTIHVAKLLSTMTKRETGPTVLEVTQTTLAETIGVTRVPVARALERLEREGLLRRKYGKIEVVDGVALRNWVEERSKLPPVD